MAGGIDWFRWHHGSVNDPKFRLVAARSGASVAEALAVWACLLEAASMAEVRGSPGVPDFEAMDCALGLADGKCQAIYTAMASRDLIAPDGEVLAWDKRQPKRERPEDDGAAQRKRNQRAREAAAAQAAPAAAEPAQVTPRHATSRQKTPREEESREDPSSPPSKKGARAAPPDRPADVDEAVWRDWLALRKAKKAPVTPTVLDSAIAEAAKACMTLEAFLRVWCARGSQGLQAEWLKPHERAQAPPGGETPRERAAREKVFRMTGGILGAKPYGADQRDSSNTIDHEPATGLPLVG